MEHIKTILKRKAKRMLAGTKIKCKRCGEEATIVQYEGRYHVYCLCTGQFEYLKTYSQNTLDKNNTLVVQ